MLNHGSFFETHGTSYCLVKLTKGYSSKISVGSYSFVLILERIIKVIFEQLSNTTQKPTRLQILAALEPHYSPNLPHTCHTLLCGATSGYFFHPRKFIRTPLINDFFRKKISKFITMKTKSNREKGDLSMYPFYTKMLGTIGYARRTAMLLRRPERVMNFDNLLYVL